jgi:hypothetical protein
MLTMPEFGVRNSGYNSNFSREIIETTHQGNSQMLSRDETSGGTIELYGTGSFPQSAPELENLSEESNSAWGALIPVESVILE